MIRIDACPPGSLKLTRTQKSLQPLAESTDLMTVVRGVIAVEDDALAFYKQLSKASEGKTACSSGSCAAWSNTRPNTPTGSERKKRPLAVAAHP